MTTEHTTKTIQEQQLDARRAQGYWLSESEYAQLQALATARLADAAERIAAALEKRGALPPGDDGAPTIQPGWYFPPPTVPSPFAPPFDVT